MGSDPKIVGQVQLDNPDVDYKHQGRGILLDGRERDPGNYFQCLYRLMTPC